jgi:hypothetical protein
MLMTKKSANNDLPSYEILRQRFFGKSYKDTSTQYQVMPMSQTTPLPTAIEKKFQRGNDILIGLGVGFLLLGSMGALLSYTIYNDSSVFLHNRDLISQISIFGSFAALGAGVIILGVMTLRSQTRRQDLLNYTTNGRIANGSGTGAVLFSAFSINFLINYAFLAESVYLIFFFISLITGIILFSIRIYIDRKENLNVPPPPSEIK